MNKYTPEERAEIVTIFIKNNRSIIATQWKLSQTYSNLPMHHKTTIFESALYVSARSLRRILKTDLNIFPYKIQLLQTLLPKDPDQRIECSNAILRLSGEIENFSYKLIMSDETHFLLSDHASKHNSWFWGTQNPQLIHETSLHPLKTSLWCGIHAKNIFGPYFFENDHAVVITDTAERYQDMIRNFLVPEMEVQG
ncbi:hypothetical protein GWI33_006533 [Rhynchophorus ferrugineus]|uniref:Transposase n=1 Tax=Rhynchophorus ferrugineus TaxID=354439 RepID=A0A834IIX9_RHYFE|nr:hypothetical protein GWI33_006533 [Rhynchophorus ferrugineus]